MPRNINTVFHGKPGYVHKCAKNLHNGQSSTEQGLAKRIKRARRLGEFTFDYADDTYVLEGEEYMPWWKLPVKR